ncbi:MAG: CDP-alcohol phosphatidyltransferase family protein [Pseudomonadota bacterium]
MLDPLMRKLIDPPVRRLAERVASAGATANGLTWTGFGFGLAAMPFLAVEQYAAALFCLAANRLLDGVDGAVARIRGSSDLGGFLDITLDFIVYAGAPFGMALAQPDEHALAAAFLIFSFMGTGSSFLAYAIIAAKRGVATTTPRGRKSIYYSAGLMEGTETFATLILVCVLPSFFVEIALIAGGLCWITTAARIRLAYRDFAPRPQSERP